MLAIRPAISMLCSISGMSLANRLTSCRATTPANKESQMFQFHYDGGHGWLAVDESDLIPLNMTAASFSHCSYQRAGILYLEEDCDAPKFLARYEAVHST